MTDEAQAPATLAVPDSAAETFGILWRELAGIVGNPATATLLRRAATAAKPRAPELEQFVVLRDKFEYRYVLPPSWTGVPASTASLHELATQLSVVLRQMTGAVVIHRLETHEDLARAGLFRPKEPS